jgi:hypothetical protein
VEILRLGGDDRAVVDFSILANAGTVEDAHKGINGAPVTNLGILADESKWVYRDIFPDFGIGVDVR